MPVPSAAVDEAIRQRRLVDDLAASIDKLTLFVNTFESQLKNKLAVVNARTYQLERQVGFLDRRQSQPTHKTSLPRLSTTPATHTAAEPTRSTVPWATCSRPPRTWHPRHTCCRPRPHPPFQSSMRRQPRTPRRCRCRPWFLRRRQQSRRSTAHPPRHRPHTIRWPFLLSIRACAMWAVPRAWIRPRRLWTQCKA
ncbi:hypothetical protein BCR44DRAFT_1059507 [Catenaria anguillulae PL171]|uniref:Uncharacterized protein n=1 Tax=Catenaria anguillulae PL171 TaxID=765915 RepID=A0A1Y2HQ95_9FUNG|nr:hypothetical protein BCR44DRAFT_1059507 [Catenaria anguillulae PL171]